MCEINHVVSLVVFFARSSPVQVNRGLLLKSRLGWTCRLLLWHRINRLVVGEEVASDNAVRAAHNLLVVLIAMKHCLVAS